MTPAHEKMHLDGVEVAGTQKYFWTRGTSTLYHELLIFHHWRGEDSCDGTLSDK